ncbi:MAG: phosphoribosylanthranilate isomerase, partial [Thermoanaerobaculia bacterium]
MDTLVKICGITRLEDALAAVEAGADMVGMVFATGSKRMVTERCASEVVAALTGAAVHVVGVFRNTAAEEINRVADGVGLDLVQLHGEESDDVARLIQRPVIRAVRVGERVPVVDGMVGEWLLYDTASGATVPVASEGSRDARRCDRDGRTTWGGTGVTFDWELVRGISDRPFFVAGG